MKKKILSTPVFFLLLINGLAAQQVNIDTMVVNNKLEKMKKNLDLSQDQVNSIKPLLLDHYEKNEMFKKNIAVMQDMKKQNNQSTDFQISKIMTTKQYNQYLKEKEVREAHSRDLHIRKQMAFYKEELKLTEQQYNELKAIIVRNADKRKELKEKYKNNEKILKSELKKMREEFKTTLSKILTKDQLEKFNGLHKH